jgi:hypothetical protein
MKNSLQVLNNRFDRYKSENRLRAGGMAQAVDYLLRKCEVLSSNPVLLKKLKSQKAGQLRFPGSAEQK